MKKAVAAALAAAFVVGTGATTFAATSPFSNAPSANSPFRDVPSTNPFSDVPRTHWAYKSIQYLKDLGILEGYANPVTGEANNEFKRRDRYGNVIPEEQQYITRYEMAQMVAKALARFEEVYAEGAISNVSNDSGDSLNRGDLDGYRDLSSREVAAVRGELQKLRAEFSNELDRLGVRVNELDGRVSELEKYADKVIWQGKIEYTYKSHRTDNSYDRGKTRVNQDDWIFRFEPIMEVNNHWTLRARIDAHADLSHDNSSNFELVRGWAQGDYDNFQVKVGRQPLYTNEDGIVWDTEYTGGEVTFGNLGNGLKATVYGGRISAGKVGGGIRHAGAWDGRQDNGSGEARFASAAGTQGTWGNDPTSFWGVNVQYTPKEHGLFVGGGFYQLKDDDFKNPYYAKGGNEDKANIWSANAGYKFSNMAQLWGAYAKNEKADYEDYSWQALFKYGNLYGGGNQGTKKGQWAVWAGYKRLGTNSSPIAINWDDAFAGTKGVVAGFSVAPMDRIVFLAKYFKGKYITGSGDAERLFGRVEFFY